MRQSSFKRAAFGCQVTTPAPIPFFQPHRVGGIGAVEIHAEKFCSFFQPNKELLSLIGRDVQFPTALAVIGHAQCSHRHLRHGRIPDRQPWHVGQHRQQLRRLWPN